jgi:transaldolase
MTDEIAPRTIKIFADGADLPSMLEAAADPMISGLTTNPTLMKVAGVTDYEAFAHEVLAKIKDKPISFEVFADELDQMESQARVIATWGDNVYVKIPVTNTKGVSTAALCGTLSRAKVKLNVTAIFTIPQIEALLTELSPDTPAVVSVFAGRIADAGVDPIPSMQQAKALLADFPKAELLWASPREILNLLQAEQSGCDIITMTPDLIAKQKSLGKNLDQFSLETVQMFYNDATAVGFTINTSGS